MISYVYLLSVSILVMFATSAEMTNKLIDSDISLYILIFDISVLYFTYLLTLFFHNRYLNLTIYLDFGYDDFVIILVYILWPFYLVFSY